MVLYFTGTGNSAFAAKVIAGAINDEAVNLFPAIRAKHSEPLFSEKPWVIASPTYCWQIPHILRDLLAETELGGNKKIYFVMTCGDDTGNAEKYLKSLCEKKNMEYMGLLPVVMPENYLAMFATPSKEKAAQTAENAKPVLLNAAEKIKRNEAFDPVPVSLVGKLYSSVVNILFYPLCVKDKKFTVNEKCLSCGKCEAVCPNANITISNGKPVWNGNCTHCMACIARCPAEAIEYGSKSKGQNRHFIEY